MNKEKPIALLHSYLADREGKNRPDRLSRINILAAAELYRHEEIDKICITVTPKLTEMQVKRLKILLNNPRDEDLIVKPQTVTTREEISSFKSLAGKNEWKHLITVGNSVHLPRIKREIKNTFKDNSVKIEARSSSEILSQYPRYFNLLNNMNNWPEQHSLSFQEKILNTPIVGELILSMAPLFSQTKIFLQTLGFKILEKR
ncbi:hypothetical protein A2422_00295 [Candidatus Woesebacteria bacterium RIFOXYC1_FULL_31_51]|uniref:Uncharacterized protein n=1 Tax=Candidatus Woesebacteria bacterium GW2011_GWC2_31_9 TaxID=1618586 RepID=A0A0F9YZ48_9BACT|nr:MAG: hypothetical protein UR17_C0001G0422 [Candidatus Woesebacteria bacterium GW2011_GWF1_31_35]KKP23089.1 MAG: hypothetical protein UR11_C0001G0063 [Candidatus Woesebacteria bacterium GW2011_GWC1_30_29]KKP26777.1 MAG: hypothetical protein UR13_C0002G0012 [Candidatus Woesebacteria bacterium GW2011_GWD1_31_12]KKP27352.1 MAG: hypothetical protein UR16_C0003G0012 [Candidatus Woesebacteria bacterium GW2011_GWB1_31_29]KKP30748.1 MAG: hypothetical protein UR20_C0053G0004 [Candidatus Woesebacteria 